MRTSSIVWAVLVSGTLCCPAGATVMYSYVTDSPSYPGAPGTIVPVKIYLQETLVGSASELAASGGVYTGGAAVEATTGGGAVVDSTGANQFAFNNDGTASTFNGGSSFNSVHYNQAATGNGNGNNLEFTEAQAAGTYPGVAPSGGKVFLGTMFVTVGSGQTTYHLNSLDNETITATGSFKGDETQSPLDPNAFTQSNYDTGAMGDGSTATGANVASPYSFSVGSASPVPEPASMAIFGLGAAGLLIKRQRTGK